MNKFNRLKMFSIFLIWLLSPLVIIFSAYQYMYGLETFRALQDDLLATFIQATLFVTPYVILFVIGKRSFIVWSAQTAQTLGLWVWFIIQVEESARDKSGASIGAGWVMLIGPFVAAVVSFFVDEAKSSTISDES